MPSSSYANWDVDDFSAELDEAQLRRNRDAERRAERYKAVGKALDSMSVGQLSECFSAMANGLTSQYDITRTEDELLLMGRIARRMYPPRKESE